MKPPTQSLWVINRTDRSVCCKDDKLQTTLLFVVSATILPLVTHLHNNAEEFRGIALCFLNIGTSIKEAAVKICAQRFIVRDYIFRVCWWCNTLCPGRWGSSAGSQVAQQRAEWPLCFVVSQVTHITTLEHAGVRALGDACGIRNAWFSA